MSPPPVAEATRPTRPPATLAGAGASRRPHPPVGGPGGRPRTGRHLPQPAGRPAPGRPGRQGVQRRMARILERGQPARGGGRPQADPRLLARRGRLQRAWPDWSSPGCWSGTTSGARPLVNAVIDLPFALPTIVAGLTLLTLYGPNSPFHLDVADARLGILFALAFVTLPFSVRSVQPVLAELDRETEEAAASLGASVRTGAVADHPPEPGSGDAGRGRPGLRPGGRRVRLGGAHLGQPAVQDRGGLVVDLQPVRERRPRRRPPPSRWCWCVIALVVLLGIGLLRRRFDVPESV